MSEKTKSILFIAILSILLSSASFGIGRLSVNSESKVPIKIDYLKDSEIDMANQSGGVILSDIAVDLKEDLEGPVVGSINSDKYHFPWCSGAQRILEENKIYFVSIEEAKNAGYMPAANCKGLK